MYVKLFSDLLASSIWCEDNETRLVWITLLVMADEDGVVRARAPGIAGMANVPRDAVDKALGKFLDPDPDSRTEDHEGRRIKAIDEGFLVLNYAKYRAIARNIDRRSAGKARQQTYRERAKDKDSVTQE